MKIFRLMVLGLLSFSLVGSGEVWAAEDNRALSREEITAVTSSEFMQAVKNITFNICRSWCSPDVFQALNYLERVLPRDRKSVV